MNEFCLLFGKGLFPVLIFLSTIYVIKKSLKFSSSNNDDDDSQNPGLPLIPILPQTPFGKILTDRQPEDGIQKVQQEEKKSRSGVVT